MWNTDGYIFKETQPIVNETRATLNKVILESIHKVDEGPN